METMSTLSRMRQASNRLGRAGCLLTCVLLAINGLIVMNLVNAVLPTLPGEFRDHRVAQAAVFLGPLVLLVIEWWVCDVAIDWLRPIGQGAGAGSQEPDGKRQGPGRARY